VRSRLGENILIKDNMMRDDDTVDEKIKALVPLVTRGAPEEKTTRALGCKFVRSGGRCVRIASTPEDPKVFIGGGGAEEAKNRVGWGTALEENS
jgi:hypothetical protein